MREMINVAFQQGWFGPFAIPNVYYGAEKPDCPVGPVYDVGPMDGLRTTSMWAQRFSQIPVVSYAQNPLLGRASLGEAPVFCKPGHIPVPTGVPGQSKCVPYSPPSAMIGPQPQQTVSTTVPPSYPQGRTFPVSPGYFNRGF